MIWDGPGGDLIKIPAGPTAHVLSVTTWLFFIHKNDLEGGGNEHVYTPQNIRFVPTLRRRKQLFALS